MTSFTSHINLWNTNNFCDPVICVQVYLAAGAVYSLEGALSDLEDCARDISSSTTETELAFLEDQVATAAAQVQQSELQVSPRYVLSIVLRLFECKFRSLSVICRSQILRQEYQPSKLQVWM